MLTALPKRSGPSCYKGSIGKVVTVVMAIGSEEHTVQD